MSFCFPRAWYQRGWYFWLSLAIVLAPALGRMHGVVHFPGEHIHVSAVAQSAIAHAASEHLAVQSWFGHHAHQADCLVFDQLVHAGLAADPLWVELPVIPFFWEACSAALVHLAFVAFFRARAPPLTSFS